MQHFIQKFKSFFGFTRLNYYLLLFLIFFGSLFLAAKPSSINSSHEALFTFGLLFLVSSALGAFVLISWEKKMKRSVIRLVRSKLDRIKPQDILNAAEIQELQTELKQKEIKITELNLALDQKLEEMRRTYLEFEDLRKNYQRLDDEYLKLKESAQEQISHKERLIQDYQKTIGEQRMIIEKKQKMCEWLDMKVRDLTSEIKSLLLLEEKQVQMAPSYSIPSNDLSLILKKYVEKAESLTGVEQLGGKNSRFLDLALDSFAIDKRRLSDSFIEEEPPGVIFIYSQTEKKFLFASRSVKTILGHGTEKFMKDFPHLVSSGYTEWKNALMKVHALKEVQANVVMQNKLGKNVSLECLMRPITQGPFAHHILGILQPNE